MTGFAQKLYDAAPVWAQNVGISLLGARARLQRYGLRPDKRVRQIRLNEQLKDEDIVRLQTRALRALLSRVQRERVGLYQSTFRSGRVDPERLEIAEFFERFPVLTKAQVSENPSAVQSPALSTREFIVTHTSGTTGSPLDVRISKSALRWNYAFFGRFLSWHGVSPLSSSVTFAGRLIVPASQAGPPYHRRNLGLNDVLLSSYRLARSTFRDYLDVILRCRPEYIDAYPSAIHSLAELIESVGLSLGDYRPKVIVTSSETLTAAQRDTVQRVFRCPVRDQYGSAEMAAFACECEQGSMHVNPDYGLFELLRADGSAAKPGEIGRIVATGFHNAAMPLLRYETGDSAILDDQPCNCGRSFPVIRQLVGRTDDLVRTPSGRLVGRLDPAFKGMPGLIEAQIVQTDHRTIVVNVVCRTALDPTLADRVRESIGSRLEPGMTVEVVQVERIERTHAGKFRSVVSLIGRKG